MRGIRLFLTFAAATLALAGCGDGDATVEGSSSAQTTSRATADQPVPYFLFHADSWAPDGGVTEGPALAGEPINVKWTASYKSFPAPNREIGAALAVANPTKGGARELSAVVVRRVSEVVVNGVAAFAGEELSGENLIASHVMWDADGFVVLFTVYETKVSDAVELAKNVASATKEQWDSEMKKAG